MIRISFSALVALTAILEIGVPAESACGALLVNGGFEDGNSGFLTDYDYVVNPTLLGAFEYTLTNNPRPHHPAAFSFGPRSGRSMFMGNSWTNDPTVLIWSQTVSVQRNSEYEFSGWARNWSFTPSNFRLPIFELQINDVALGTYSMRDNGSWEELSFSWNSGQLSTAKIELFEVGGRFQAPGGGNDFVFDDLAFSGPAGAAVPEPSVIAMWSVFGLCGVGYRCRRRRVSHSQRA